MKHIVFHVETGRVVKEFKYRKCAVKLMNNLGLDYAVTNDRASLDWLTMKVRNLMTGAEVEIAADTPWCCNPASETYWSM